jgi:predicted permease
VTVLGAIWIVDVRSLSIAALPFIGVGAILLGGLLAMGAASLLALEPRQTGALVPCGAFTNIGAIGALICYVYLGEKGFALVPFTSCSKS